MKPLRLKPAGLIAFVATSALILGTASLNANPPHSQEHKAALDVVSRHFKPKVAEPTREVRGVDVGRGFRAEFIPVQDDAGSSVDVVITRDADARGVATTRLDLECTFTSSNFRSRVPRPAQVETVRQEVAATLAPGQSLRKRVTFKPRAGQGASQPGQLIVRAGGSVISQDIYLAGLAARLQHGNDPNIIF